MKEIILTKPFYFKVFGFTTMMNRIIFDTRLSDGGYRMFSVLRARMFQGYEVPIRLKVLAGEMGWSEDKVERKIAELIKLGYIRKKRYGLNRANKYFLWDYPQTPNEAKRWQQVGVRKNADSGVRKNAESPYCRSNFDYKKDTAGLKIFRTADIGDLIEGKRKKLLKDGFEAGVNKFRATPALKTPI